MISDCELLFHITFLKLIKGQWEEKSLSRAFEGTFELGDDL